MSGHKSSPSPSCYPLSFPLQEIYDRYATNFCLRGENFAITFHQFYCLLDSLSSSLFLTATPSSSKSSRRILALHLRPRWEFFPLLFWAWQEGFVVLPIFHQAPLEQIKVWIRSFQIDVLITDQSQLFSACFIQKANDTSSTFSMIALDTIPEFKDGISFQYPLFSLRSLQRFSNWNLDQEAVIILTSGSLGEPKGILHTLRSLYFSALGTNKFFDLSPQDSWPLSLPLNHVGGLLIFLRTFLGGGTCLIPTSFRDIWATLEQYQPTFLSLVPAQLITLMQSSSQCHSPMTFLKAILLGGGPIPPWVLKEAYKRKIPLSPTYGMTESCAQVSALHPQDFLQGKHHQTCGEVLPFRELQVNHQQQIRIRGPILARGQIKKNNLISLCDEEGWFQTQDLGILEPGENGKNFLVLHGRADQVLISGGENINPLTIENLTKGLPGVYEAIIVAVPHPKYGEVPWLFWEGDDSPVLPFAPFSDWNSFFREKLPSFMVPKRIIRLRETPFSLLENTGNIKYSRNKIREWAKNLAQETGPG